MLVKGTVLLTAGLIAGVVVAVVLAGGGADEAPREPVLTATAVAKAASLATPTDTPVAAGAQEPELYVGQIVGMRGCDEPVFASGGGFAPRTRVQLERVDNGQTMEAATSEAGFVALDARSLFADSCMPGVRYPLRLVDESSGRELATSWFEVPVFSGTIEVEPASGGCTEIVVTVRGMPPNADVGVIAYEPEPFAHNGFSIVWPTLQTDGDGFARSAPFAPPWRCSELALSLFAMATLDGQLATREGELLYRIAIGADEPLPGVERWLSVMGR